MNGEFYFLVQGFLWFCGWGVFILVLYHLRLRHRQKIMETLQKERVVAMEKGIPLPELPQYEDLVKPSQWRRQWQNLRLNPRWPLGAGVMSIFLGVGFSLACFLPGDSYHNQIWPFGLIAVFFGGGLLLQDRLMRQGASKEND